MLGMAETGPGGPATPQTPNPFTPDGQASVTDWATEYDGKEFYTFTTPAGNVFFLVIDHARNSDNVYFLNAVTESDLISLAEKAGEPISVNTVPATANPAPEPTGDEPGTDIPAGSDTETPTEETGGNTGMTIFIVVAVLAVGGAGYYIKIVKPKKQSAGIADDDEDEPEDDEDIPFADDTEEPDSHNNGDSSDDDYSDYGDPDDEDIEESGDGEEGEDE